jgi:hypothetical protein
MNIYLDVKYKVRAVMGSATTQGSDKVVLDLKTDLQEFDYNNRTHIMSLLAAYQSYRETIPSSVLGVSWEMLDLRENQAAKHWNQTCLSVSVDNDSGDTLSKARLRLDSSGRKHIKHSVQVVVDGNAHDPEEFVFTVDELRKFETLNNLSGTRVEE